VHLLLQLEVLLQRSLAIHFGSISTKIVSKQKHLRLDEHLSGRHPLRAQWGIVQRLQRVEELLQQDQFIAQQSHLMMTMSPPNDLIIIKNDFVQKNVVPTKNNGDGCNQKYCFIKKPQICGFLL
jgi:hypothetical protein